MSTTMTDSVESQVPRSPVLRLGSVLSLTRRHVLALARTWKVAITWFVLEPWIVLMGIALGIGKLVGNVEGGLSYPEFVAPGILVGGAMFHALGDSAWAAFDRVNQNIYETQLTAPITVYELVAAEYAFAMIRAMLSTLSIGALAMALGWIPFTAMPGLLVVSIMVGGVFAGIGQLFAATAPSMNALTLVFTLVATPLYFFSGTFFPISVLPDWLEPVAWAAPLTPLVQIGRAISIGEFGMIHVWCAVYAVVLAAVLYLVAVRLMRRRLMK